MSIEGGSVEMHLAAKPIRAPQQGRSRASYERMIAAAEHLLRERGSDDFTLLEVSKVGKVSIGSIYNRFDSKDELLRAVHGCVLLTVDRAQREMVDRAEAKAANLGELVHLLVEGIADILREQAPLMRPMMLRAGSDPMIMAAGKRSFVEVERLVCDALLSHRAEIGRRDPDRAVASAYRITYSAIARFLGFGATMDSGTEGDWNDLKADLGAMVSAFLQTNG